MTHYVIEDDFGPFVIAKDDIVPGHGDKVLFEGNETDAKAHLQQLMKNILDDSPTEFWRDYETVPSN